MRNIKDAVTVLEIVLFIQQFEVSMCKISYTQFLEYEDVEPYLRSLGGLKIINLQRGNWVASAISEMIRHKEHHPTHAFYQRPNVGAVHLDPERLWSIIWQHKGQARKVASILDTFENAQVLSLSYPQIVGGEGNEAVEIPEEVGKQICDFLEVPFEPMYCGYMRKATNNYKMVSNWGEIREKLAGTKFDGMMRIIEDTYGDN